MPEVTLSRRQKNLLMALLTRGGRKRARLCRCEGVRAVRELLDHQQELVEFIVTTPAGRQALDRTAPGMFQVDETEMASLSDLCNSQGVIAVAAIPEAETSSVRGDFILALDQLNDPGNFGTIARTFRAVGGSELWYTSGSVDPWCDKAIRSGMGAQFALNCRKFSDLTELCRQAEQAGYPEIFISTPRGGENCFTAPKLFEKSVVVIGNEANGVTTFPQGAHMVTIPMPGNFESLNAAQAATVLLLEHVRRQTTAQSSATDRT